MNNRQAALIAAAATFPQFSGLTGWSSRRKKIFEIQAELEKWLDEQDVQNPKKP